MNVSKNKAVKSGHRHSLATIISTAFISIVLLFMVAMSLSYYRMISLQSVISHITEYSFPEITHSRNLHDQANKLLYLSDSLTGATNQAMLRTVKNDIEVKTLLIIKQSMRQQSDYYLVSQLDAIDHEFANLSDLVAQKLSIQAQLLKGQNHMFTLHEQMFKLFQISSNDESTISASNTWSLDFSEVIALSSQAFIKLRLQEVRQNLEDVAKKINLLNHMLATLPKPQQRKAKAITFELWQLLLGNDGLLFMKIEQLRINGRVIGRSNFVKSLVNDFSRVVEFKSYQITESVLLETDVLKKRASIEAKMMIVAAILMLLGLFSVIYFIKKRFVERVVNLNTNIMMRLKGDVTDLDVSGNDEISDIAEAFNIFANKIEQQNEVLHELSLTDGLTGLANRRALDQRLNHDLLTAKRNKGEVIIMLLDIDFFKEYNDYYGHLAGDDNLQLLSTALARCNKRSTDFVARYGGDEFMFILPNTELYGAQKIANEIIAEVKSLNILHKASSVASHVTLSIGIASSEHQPNMDAVKLIAMADKALYKAKLSGRNSYYPENKES
jgi:diguanylate cyclase (GGDEF)-like protein